MTLPLIVEPDPSAEGVWRWFRGAPDTPAPTSCGLLWLTDEWAVEEPFDPGWPGSHDLPTAMCLLQLPAADHHRIVYDTSFVPLRPLSGAAAPSSSTATRPRRATAGRSKGGGALTLEERYGASSRARRT